ncbi:MAG: ATP-dependent DNA helicase RecG [Deltaproteobacteria bacterium]|nr:ATP-dependent DNA helicase RecG [Deltaproteobacteria bacterium]
MAFKSTPYLKKIQKLTLPINHLKGVGPKRAFYLEKKGLHTVLDLLFFAPIRYEDRTRITPVERAAAGESSLIRGRIVSGGEERFYRSRKRLFRIVLEDRESLLDLIWFKYRRPYLETLVKPGREVTAFGRIGINKGRRQMIHPDIDIPDTRGKRKDLGFYPVYSSIEGISDNFLRSLIRTTLNNHKDSIIDPVPERSRKRTGLPDLVQALEHIHFPPDGLPIERLNEFDTPFHRRLIFDRFLLVMLYLAYEKKTRDSILVEPYKIPEGGLDNIINLFPFRLTDGQVRAMEDIRKDLASGRQMNRLLMGDVGCGKTVIAAFAAYVTSLNNRQTALMVPTQVLANQHFDYFINLSEKMGFRPVMVTGDLPGAERRRRYDAIKNNHYDIVIGTHSLIQERLLFGDLGLVIIDEQHRFGVRQRSLMKEKAENTHLMVMTATPIPRTLAITAFGDIDISTIEEYPEGHKSIETLIIDHDQKAWAFEELKRRLSKGEQAFVICPVIGYSEDNDLKSAQEMESRLKAALDPPYKVSLVHGRMSMDEKTAVMEAFRKGRIDLLIGTTVIEVGVHVPNATIMIIEHPEMFGLAQLHQLRGRVGRGLERGLCLLILADNLSEKAVSRLKGFSANHDGFKIAKMDLELRGHGEMAGLRQSGLGEIDFSELVIYGDILLTSRREALSIIESDPELKDQENLLLKRMLEAIAGKKAIL